jgi:hypothetical protein
MMPGPIILLLSKIIVPHAKELLSASYNKTSGIDGERVIKIKGVGFHIQVVL